MMFLYMMLLARSEKTMQIRLAVISNAGGSGKTTLSVHLAYELAKRSFNVALMDRDGELTIELFAEKSVIGAKILNL